MSTLAPAPRFHTWQFQGVRFLAVPSGSGWHISDEYGGNWGSWGSVTAARKLQRTPDPNGPTFIRWPSSSSRPVATIQDIPPDPLPS